jgi:bacterioferritin-associated ferredoxin
MPMPGLTLAPDFENHYQNSGRAFMYVCICKAVTERAVKAAIAGGAGSVDEVGRCTGAGTDCGSCRLKIARELSRAAESSPSAGPAVAEPSPQPA